MEKKRVLVCSVPCWNSKTGSDTLSSLMEGYDIDKIANLYTKEGFPDSPVCNVYFRISENAVVKSLINRKIKTGKRINLAEGQKDDNQINATATENRYKKVASKRNYILLISRELIWKLGKWKTKELDEFIDDFKPDVVFFPMEGYMYFNRINRYILKRTSAKGVGYFWDDNFTYKQSNRIGYKIYRFFQRISLRKTAKLCFDFFAITQKTKEEADKVFNINCSVLTKPIDLSKVSYECYKPSWPIKMLYTGKLIIGRFDVIKLVGDVLDEINCDTVKMELDVYTTTQLSDEQKNSLSKYVHVLGAIPQSEVAGVQAKADILLFAEAISGKNSLTARLSFSTKITDYFKSGKCIFAVGNPNIAPIEYLKIEDAALVACNKQNIKEQFIKIINNPEIISHYSLKAYECGRKNHDKTMIREKLFNTLNS